MTNRVNQNLPPPPHIKKNNNKSLKILDLKSQSLARVPVIVPVSEALQQTL